MAMIEHFHCVSCEEQKHYKESDMLFRTGFFRSSLPLGCCRTCSPAQAKPASACVDHKLEVVSLPSDMRLMDVGQYKLPGRVLSA